MENHNEIYSRITVRPFDRMQGVVKIIAVGERDVNFSITVKQLKDIQSNVQVYSDNVIDKIGFPPVYGNQRRSSVIVKYRDDIRSNITVRPHGKMTGIIDVLEPPKITANLEPNKDAFVREGVKTLNYGSAQTMLIGGSIDNNEAYRSFVAFDTSKIPRQQTLLKAVLKLYNSSAKSVSQTIEIHSANSGWEENSVTWLNQPASDNLITTIDLGSQEGYVEIDVFDIVNDWINDRTENNGFILKATDEKFDQYVQIYTKDSSNNNYKPKLEIVYRDDATPPSIGNSNIRSNTYVLFRNSIASRINIPIYDINRELPSKIRVKDPATIFSNISISRPDVISNILVRRTETKDIIGKIGVRQPGLSEYPGKISINKPDMPSRIGVPYSFTIPSSITVMARGETEAISNIYISRPDMLSNVIVPYRDDIMGKIKVIANKDSALIGTMSISRPDVISNILIRRLDTSDVNGSITVRRLGVSQNKSTISVSKPDMVSNIKVNLFNSLNSTMSVRRTKDTNLSGNIYVFFRSDVQGSMEVVKADRLPSSIEVITGYLKSSLFVPFSDSNDLISKATIRVSFISELPSRININSEYGGGTTYVFIM